MIDNRGKGAFWSTDLHAILQHRGIQILIVTGGTTEVCVNTTVREASSVAKGTEFALFRGMAGDFLKFPDISKIFPQSEQQKIKPLQVPTLGDRSRVLLADDDPVHSLTVFHFLSQAGFEVVVAVTGTDAIAELRKVEHPPVAILRAALPGMNGAEICQRMRDAGKDVYLIVQSEAPTTDEIVAGLEGGAHVYVPNAIPPEVLLAHVKVGTRLMARQQGGE